MPKGYARCRANKAYTALHHGEGVWGFGKDAEIERPKALQDAKPTKRSYRDREQALFLKNILSLQSELPLYSHCYLFLSVRACTARIFFRFLRTPVGYKQCFTAVLLYILAVFMRGIARLWQIIRLVITHSGILAF